MMPATSEDKKKSNRTNFIIGMSVGTGILSLILYLLLRRRCQEILLPLRMERAQTYTFIPPKPIQLAMHPGKTDEKTEPRQFPLELRARPSVFRRRETGSLVVTTLPGTLCTIEARYSTGAAPFSLNTNTISVGPSGQYRWIWDIGTVGSYVDVILRAEREGYEAQTKKLSVDIVD